MNFSISSAEMRTDSKIVVTALAAAIAFIWIGRAARPSTVTDHAKSALPHDSAASLIAAIENKRL